VTLTEILHELVDAVHIARTITSNRQAELHQAVDDLKQFGADAAAVSQVPAPAPAPALVPAAEQPAPQA
jgi:hypothetical protein